MFRRPCLVAESAREVIPAADLVPLSLLELDLAAPVEGWNLHLADRNIEIVEDDIGRAAVSRPDVRMRGSSSPNTVRARPVRSVSGKRPNGSTARY
jgi:hypothetical protein